MKLKSFSFYFLLVLSLSACTQKPPNDQTLSYDETYIDQEQIEASEDLDEEKENSEGGQNAGVVEFKQGDISLYLDLNDPKTNFSGEKNESISDNFVIETLLSPNKKFLAIIMSQEKGDLAFIELHSKAKSSRILTTATSLNHPKTLDIMIYDIQNDIIHPIGSFIPAVEWLSDSRLSLKDHLVTYTTFESKDIIQTDSYESINNQEPWEIELVAPLTFITDDGWIVTVEHPYEQEAEAGQAIGFGPVKPLPESPTGTNKYDRPIYSLNRLPGRNAESILAELDEEIEITTKIINDLQVAQWDLPGLCNERFMEVLGESENIQLYTSGCHSSAEEDWKLFERMIEMIER